MAVVACFHPPTTVVATTVLSQTSGSVGTTPGAITEGTGAPTSTTTSLPPTTTTMNYCVDENGMNQPLTIKPNQVTSNPSPDETTPPGDINPTSSPTSGVNYPSMNPQINVTLDQPATLTVVYLPVDRPNEPSNVDDFTVVFIYPNGTSSPAFDANIPSSGASATTTPASGAPSETTTAPSTTGVIAPSSVSPQVDLPPNFRVPQGTIVSITITSTKDQSNPREVCTI